MGLFVSRYLNRIDKKGRVSVPAPFRTALGPQAPAGVVAYRYPNLPTVEAAGMDRAEQLAESLDRLPQYSAERESLSLMLAGFHHLAFDPEGRVMLPAELIQYAGLADQVLFVGVLRTFQLWEPQRFGEHHEAALKRVRERKTTLPPSSSGGI